MKILVEQAGDKDKKVLMKTSVRGPYYTIKFHNKDEYNAYHYLNWGHLNVRQAKMMIKELKWFIKNN